MRTVTVTVGPLASAVANNIALSQTPTTTFTLNGSLVSGGVATLDKARRVLFTPAGNESSNTFTIVGTDLAGNPQTDVVAGANATATYSALDFLTVTSITCLNSAAGAITVGTNGVAASGWVCLDEWAPAATALQTVVSGTVNYTVQQTLDDPNSTTAPVTKYLMTWFSSPDSNLVGATGNVQSNYAFTPRYVRVLLNSGTGSVTFKVSQTGVNPR